MTLATELVAKVRDQTSARVYVVCTGAGAGLQQLLWTPPGASSFLVGASFPYAEEAVNAFLGFAAEHYGSAETAVDLASSAYLRAGAGSTAVGVAITGVVASVREHRGAHRIYAATVTRTTCRVYAVTLERATGEAARVADGARADALGLVALLDAAGIASDALAPSAGEYAITDADVLGRQRLLERPFFRASGAREAAPAHLTLALPGTFDPPHPGHFGMAAAAEAMTNARAVMWITAEPPHKAAVPLGDLLARASWLRGHDTLFSKGEPLYMDKARRYPGASFVLGTDALIRMLDPKWGPDVASLLAEFRRLGTRFYVASRVVDGAWVTLRDVPDAPSDLFFPLDGRWDVSSTELRRSNRP